MDTHTFIAGSAGEALEQIRHQLGPEAVVLNVRRLPAAGLSRLWQKPRIEVTAHVPGLAEPSFQNPHGAQSAAILAEPASGSWPVPASVLELRDQLRASLERKMANRTPVPFSPNQSAIASDVTVKPGEGLGMRRGAHGLSPRNAFIQLLTNSGLAFRLAERVANDLRAQSVPISASETDQVILAREALRPYFRTHQPSVNRTSGAHIFVGPPGVGKTTALCKWLAQSVLLEAKPARVWRLDGDTTNAAESLSVYAEILGVPVERFVPNDSPAETDLILIDLPGTNAADSKALHKLSARINDLPCSSRREETHFVSRESPSTSAPLPNSSAPLGTSASAKDRAAARLARINDLPCSSRREETHFVSRESPSTSAPPPISSALLGPSPSANDRNAARLGLTRQPNQFRMPVFPNSQPPLTIHLVLNAAYDADVLVSQARAFSALPIHDVVFTHLDEQPRWGILWNFLLEANFAPGFFSAGQNVPGDFQPATVDALLDQQFNRAVPAPVGWQTTC